MPLSSPLVFSEIFQNSESTSILIMDPGGRIEDVNIGFLKTFGYTRDAILGKNFSILFIEEDLKNKVPQKVIQKVLDKGSSFENNFLKKKDGSFIWIHGECIYAKDEKGQVHIVKIVKDLSKTKILEQKLKERNEEQERIIKDNDTFIYTTSHDLTSPINNIDGLVTLLEESHDKPEEVKSLVPLFRESVERLRNKLKELSAMGREREEEQKKKPVIVFQKILQDVLLDLAKETESSGAEIHSDFSEAPTIAFLKKNMKSVMQNLVSNAVKYRFPGRKLRINIKTSKVGDDFTLLTVQDNGLGIEEMDRERIFQMYQRAHPHIKGSGVGLGIVQKIIKNSGGKIEVESKVGEGTVMKIFFKGPTE